MIAIQSSIESEFLCGISNAVNPPKVIERQLKTVIRIKWRVSGALNQCTIPKGLVESLNFVELPKNCTKYRTTPLPIVQITDYLPTIPQITGLKLNKLEMESGCREGSQGFNPLTST